MDKDNKDYGKTKKSTKHVKHEVALLIAALLLISYIYILIR